MLLVQYFWKGYSFQQKNVYLSDFSNYNFNKIYVDNPQIKLFQPI